MLNNATFCRMPLLPNNIPISDSGFENVNAFNTVTPHSHQTGENSRTGEARTYSRRKHGQRQNKADLHQTTVHIQRDTTCKDTQRNIETDTYMLTYKPDTQLAEREVYTALSIFFLFRSLYSNLIYWSLCCFLTYVSIVAFPECIS